MFFHRLIIIACTYILVYVNTLFPFLFCNPSFSQKSCTSRQQFLKFFVQFFLFNFFVQFFCSIFFFSLGFCECCVFDIFDPSCYSTCSHHRICCFHDKWRGTNSEKQLGFSSTVSTTHVQTNQIFFPLVFFSPTFYYFFLCLLLLHFFCFPILF